MVRVSTLLSKERRCGMRLPDICTIAACVFFAAGGLLNLSVKPSIGVAMIMIAIANFILMTQ